jgi:prepilin-type N-terminal cleavage/methylation domain-containing protein
MRTCTNRKRNAGPHRLATQAGFTLIEVLMVIAIIGVLVGLLVPAVNIARRKVQQSAIVFEVQTLANSIEQYKTKFGEYPPDGSSASVFKRHIRKVFPNASPTELADLDVAVGCNQLPTPSAAAEFRVMDPSEALVFFLGGFSDDPIHPFTGPGGPLQVLSRNSAGVATSVQYNVDRNNPIFAFKQSQLTLEVVSGLTVSTDEAVYALPAAADGSTVDVIPAYHPSGRLAPYVYFDSRTYASGGYISHFSPGSGSVVTGFARPYKSDQVNTSVSHASAPDSYYRYANDRSFQIVSAGLDDAFGNVSPLTNGTQFFVYPTGQLLDITIAPGSAQPGALAYVETTGQPSAQLDNAANFADGILGDGLDN